MGRTVGIKDGGGGGRRIDHDRLARAERQGPSAGRDAPRGCARWPSALGYQPERDWRAASPAGRTGMLAMTVSPARGDFALQVGDFDYFIQLMNGATSAALERGYALDAAPGRRRARRCSTACRSTAAIVDRPGRRGDPIVARAARARRAGRHHRPRRPTGPTTLPGSTTTTSPGTRADARPPRATRARTAVALLTAPPLRVVHVRRQAAYRAWCAERGQQADGRDGHRQRERGRGRTPPRSSCSTRADPPDGIYATLDRLALGALLAAEARGRRRPGRTADRRLHRQRRQPSRPPRTHGAEPQPGAAGARGGRPSGRPGRAERATERHRIVPATVVPRASTAT